MLATIEQIYRQHRKGLFTLALSITRREDSAEDAVHDAVVRLCRSQSAPTGDPVAYVFAAVRNAAVDQKRRRGLVSIFELPEQSQIAESEAAGVLLQAQERDRTISEAIDALPDEQREAVVLHLYSGLTFQQAGEVLDVPLQTMASRYRRALVKLRETLGQLE